jgi:iron complex outermembrane receptor protein
MLSNYTLVLVRGRQINDSLVGGTLWTASGIQLENIERIAMIRGPGGIVWGAKASWPLATVEMTWRWSRMRQLE